MALAGTAEDSVGLERSGFMGAIEPSWGGALVLRERDGAAWAGVPVVGQVGAAAKAEVQPVMSRVPAEDAGGRVEPL